MIRAGLCSVTLRAQSVEDVARVAGAAGLRAIEWGADVHVRPGDIAAVRRARDASGAADVDWLSYGSYLFAGGLDDGAAARRVLDTAVELGARHVRVWSSFGVEPGSDAYGRLVDALRVVCADAADRGLAVSVEFHGGTATHTVAGAVALVAAVDAPNLFSLWQPPYWRGPTGAAADAAEIATLGPRLSHLHVYEWAGPELRLPLAVGAERWQAVLAAAGGIGGDRVAFLEFVAGDDPDAVVRDARTLRGWLDAG
ncbi:MAG: sugar phosphate isomerase/epimerase family protein [Acidimicrobiia bacterium]